jgi:DNA-binding transcriptional LysR family regulator
MSMSVCNAVSRTQFTQNPCHACYGARLGRSARLVGRSPRQEFLSARKALGVATSTVARRIEAFERALGRPLVLSGNDGTAIDADVPSLIALAKQMELGFDALLRAPDAQRITGAVRGSRILAGARRTF